MEIIKETEVVDNYKIMEDQNRLRFLSFDQNKIISKWNLDADELEIRFKMLGIDYRLERATGKVFRGDEPATVNATMTIYDMFCYSDERPVLANDWVSIEQIGGIIATHHVEHLLNDPAMKKYAGKIEELKKACIAMNGTETKPGDVSYILPLFDFFPLWLKFYDADDEFPVSLTFLWDRNATQFLHYETMWYTMSFVKEELEKWL